jgi:hypothetical protein
MEIHQFNHNICVKNMPISHEPRYETLFSIPMAVHSSLLRILLFRLLMKFIKDSRRRLFSCRRSYKFPFGASCVLQCSLQAPHPRLTACPEVHNLHWVFMSVYILTSSRSKLRSMKEKIPLILSARHTEYCIMTTFLLHCALPTFPM